jgi:hypothetical protein
LVQQSRGDTDVTDQRTDPTAPISWRSIVYGTPVMGSDETQVGVVREVLGSDGDDIFHGLRVHLNDGNRDVLIDADDITLMASDGIVLGVNGTFAAGLPDFDEPATYHLSSVGWLRHHLGWKADSKSDEGPG